MIPFLLRARFLILSLTVVSLAALVAVSPEVRYDQSLESFFAEDDPVVLAYRDASALFGNDQFVFVAYDDPELLTPRGIDRVAELAARIRSAEIDGVVGVQSLDALPVLWKLDAALLALESVPKFVRPRILRLIERGLADGGAGSWATPTIGGAIRSANEDQLASLRERIRSHPLFVGTLVDRTGTTTALMVQLKSAGEHDAKATVGALRTITDAFAEEHDLPRRPAVVGPPVLLADGFRAIELDGRRLSTVGMLLIGLVTLTATRSLWWALVPLVAGWTVWLGTVAVLSALDLRLSLSSGPLVAQIIVLTMPAASHLALHFRDDRFQMGARRPAALETLRAVSPPILWCAATATIGYAALVTSNIVPIRQFGAVLAIATAVATIGTLLLSPSAMLPVRPLELATRPGTEQRTSQAMNRLTAWVHRRAATIILLTLGLALPIIAGIPQLKYESNYINAFKPETRVVEDYRFVESRMGGIGLVGIVLPVEELTPASLDRLQTLDDRIENLRSEDGEPVVSSSTSLATVIDPDRRFADLSDERRAWLIETKRSLIAASPQAEMLERFWRGDAGRARTLVRLSESQPAPAKMAAFARAERLARQSFGDEAFLTGLSHLLTQTTRGVIETQWSTFTYATVGILLMLILAFRGPVLAFLALMPTLIAVGLVLGLMGWLGLKLDIATALVASVALGLSVDDTFHCLLQFKRLRRHGSFREALFGGYAVTGPGVLLSSLAVALGFSVLRFSEFVPFSTFGLMVAIATAGSSLGNIVLLPACLSLQHRWRSRSGPASAAQAGTQTAGTGTPPVSERSAF